MPSKFLNISVDNTLGGASPSDQTVSSQKAIKEYVDGNYVTIATTQTISGSKTFTEPVTIQNGQGTGCLIVGANVNSSNLTNNQRKLARINAPSYANKDLSATLIGWDTSGDSDSPVTNKSYDSVCFGGMKKITNCTSPMSITFCVTDTRAATAAANKKYALAMDANAAIFSVQPKYGSYNLATTNDLPTVNDATITITQGGVTKGSFTLNQSSGDTIALDAGGGSVDIDGVSITKNSDDELQTVGVIDQNNTSNAIKTWTGTKAQYDAIVSKDANTIYNITDDTNPTQALLEAIYPVGSIYIGTMNTCPLAALFGTWTLVGTKILTDVSSTAGVVGNGIAIGLTNGTDNAGMVNIATSSIAITGKKDYYGESVSSSTVAVGNYALGTIGLTTDSTKSGMVADLASATTLLTVNIWERTA